MPTSSNDKLALTLRIMNKNFVALCGMTGMGLTGRLFPRPSAPAFAGSRMALQLGASYTKAWMKLTGIAFALPLALLTPRAAPQNRTL